MKKALRIVALLVAVFMLVAVVAACGDDKTEETTAASTTAATTTTKAPEATAPATDDDQPGDDDDDDDEEVKVETPIDSDGADEFHAAHKLAVVDVESIETDLPLNWGEKDPGALFDGADGFFNTEDAETKLGSGTQNFMATITFKIEKAKVVAYALVTGNDSGQYTGRTPTAWTLKGSNDGENWTDIDVVEDGATEDLNHAYFGYEIDAGAQAEYTWLQFVFDAGTGNAGLLESIQLNEIYIYVA